MEAPQALCAPQSSYQHLLCTVLSTCVGAGGKGPSLHRARHELEVGHRLTEWLRLVETSGNLLVQHPCSNQALLQQVAESHGQSGFKYLKGWRPYVQPVTGFDDSHSTKVFSYV